MKLWLRCVTLPVSTNNINIKWLKTTYSANASFKHELSQFHRGLAIRVIHCFWLPTQRRPTTWSWKSRLGVKLSPRFGAGCGTWHRSRPLTVDLQKWIQSNNLPPKKNWATLKSKSVLDQINGFYMFLPNQWFLPNLCIVDFCQPKKSTLPKTSSLTPENRPLLPQKEAGLSSNHSFSGVNSLFSFREGIPILEGHEAYLTP